MRYTHSYTFSLEINTDEEYPDRVSNYHAYMAVILLAGKIYRAGDMPRALHHFDTEDHKDD